MSAIRLPKALTLNGISYPLGQWKANADQTGYFADVAALLPVTWGSPPVALEVLIEKQNPGMRAYVGQDGRGLVECSIVTI